MDKKFVTSLFGSGFQDFGKEFSASRPDNPVLVIYRIHVWTGTETEMFQSENVGENRLVRRKIVPRDFLKPFLDIRTQAKKLCSLYGEPYLGGYAVAQEHASEVLSALKVLRDQFLREREGRFSEQMEMLRQTKGKGLCISECSSTALCPSDSFIMRRIRFEFDAFALEGAEGTSSFIESFRNATALEAEELAEQIEPPVLSDSVVRRTRELAKRLFAWRAFDEDVEICAAKLAAASTSNSIHSASDIKSALEEAARILGQAASSKKREVIDACPETVLSAQEIESTAVPCSRLISEGTHEDHSSSVVCTTVNSLPSLEPGEEDTDSRRKAPTEAMPGNEGWTEPTVHPILRRSLFFA